MPLFQTMRLPFKPAASAAWTVALSATLFMATAPVAHAATPVYDNLSSSQDGSDPVYSYGPLADAFSTGAQASTVLAGVTLLLKNDGPDLIGSLHVGLYADKGNAPGTELVSLGELSSASIGSAAFATYNFTPVSAFALSQNTRYWIQIDAVTPSAVSWSWSNDTAALGVAGQFSHSAVLGTSANSDIGPYQMAVTVAAVPEPEAWLMAVCGLASLGIAAAKRRSAH